MQINFDKLFTKGTQYAKDSSVSKNLQFWKYDNSSKTTLNSKFNLGFQGFNLSGIKRILATETINSSNTGSNTGSNT